MINTDELRRKLRSGDIVDHVDIHANVKSLLAELIDRLEAAESDAREQARMNGMGSEREAALMARLEEEKTHYENTYKKLLKERKITSSMVHNIMQMSSELKEIERQKPVGKFMQHPSNGIWEQDVYGDNPEARPLYLGPSTQRE